MLAVIHLNWLVQQRPERPICSFLPLRHNVRCHSAGGPQLGSAVTDDRYPRSLPPGTFSQTYKHPPFNASLLESLEVDRLGQKEQENEIQRGLKSSAVRFVPVFEKLKWWSSACISKETHSLSRFITAVEEVEAFWKNLFVSIRTSARHSNS